MYKCGLRILLPGIREVQYALAVFILEDALSVQTDNASMVVFILRTHYPTGQTWANICSSSGYASQA